MKNMPVPKTARSKSVSQSANNSIVKSRRCHTSRMEGVATGPKVRQVRKTLFGRAKSVSIKPELSKKEARLNEDLKTSNRSKYARNWISGPTHEI